MVGMQWKKLFPVVGQCAGERELGEMGEVSPYGGRREQPVAAAIAIAPATDADVTATVLRICPHVINR